MTNPSTTPDVIDILAHFDEQRPRNKTFLRQISQPPKRFYLTTLLVIAWTIAVFVLSPLLLIKVPHPVALYQQTYVPVFYTFQVPIVILASGILGVRYGVLAIFLYLVLGLAGLPVFAGGGGISYWMEPSFGYLIGFLITPWAIHSLLQKAFAGTGWFKGRSLWLAGAALTGVVVIHFVGLLGLVIQGLVGVMSWSQVMPWVEQLTWPVVVYDVVFSVIALALVRLFRMLLWFCLY